MSLLKRKQKLKKALKTENMKTTMKHLAAGTFIALILIVGNVRAEGTETKATSQAIETSLQVEKWMTDETIWNTKSISLAEIAMEIESTLELESWMTNSETWNFSINVVEEAEENMEIECWMTCDEIWDTTTNMEEKEKELTVESWMTNENNWNREF
jgi:hypothetical protein